MELTVDSRNIFNPNLLKEILLMKKRELYNEIEYLRFNDAPEGVRVYFGYLDILERAALEVQYIKCIDTFYAEFKEDSYMLCGDVAISSPYKSDEVLWMFTDLVESIRWELELEDLLFLGDYDYNDDDDDNDDDGDEAEWRSF